MSPHENRNTCDRQNCNSHKPIGSRCNLLHVAAVHQQQHTAPDKKLSATTTTQNGLHVVFKHLRKLPCSMMKTSNTNGPEACRIWGSPGNFRAYPEFSGYINVATYAAHLQYVRLINSLDGGIIIHRRSLTLDVTWRLDLPFLDGTIRQPSYLNTFFHMWL